VSYLHCPSCRRAYNVATSPTCPACPVAATPVDATDDVVAAADRLARAIARASAVERAAAVARLEQLALPAATGDATVHVARAIRDAIVPAMPPPPRSRREPWLAAVIALAGRLPAPRLVRRAWSRVRALAA
jgi:hypothetical protein